MIYTLGHSRHSIEKFIELAKGARVGLIVDIRSVPRSRFCPQFNRDALRANLARAGVRYEYLGDHLGGRSNDPSVYKNGTIQYDLLAQTREFAYGLSALKGLDEHSPGNSVAIMCSEADPIACHRTLLVARFGSAQGLEFSHVYPDGSITSQLEMENRILALPYRPDVSHLPREQALPICYAKVSDRMAHRSK